MRDPGREAPGNLRKLIDRRAEDLAGKSALVFPDAGESLDYAGLRRAVRRRCALLTRNLPAGAHVAQLLPNGRAAVEWMLGAIYGGFVSVPLDPNAGEPFLRFALKQADCRGLVAPTDHPAAVIAAKLGIRHIDPLAEEDPEPLPASPAPAAPAILDFTSGTTGRPKAVLVSHAGLIANATWHHLAHGSGADERSVLLLPLHHMNAQGVSLLTTLYGGGMLVVPAAFRPAEFIRFLGDHQITWVAAVPAMLYQLLAWAEQQRDPLPEFPHARFIRSSSAPLSPKKQQLFEQRFGIPVIEAMGMSEAGGTIFFNPLPPQPRKYGSVGRPVGYEVRVVDDQGRVLADGETGSLEVRGRPVMLGYYAEPEATRARFSDDGWLRMGDLGYRDIDGFYFITGRSSEIVNKGGEKIGLREVDDVLMSAPGVREAAAVAVPDEIYGDNLVAFSVGAGTESDLLAHCQRELGVARAPYRVFQTEALARNQTGKIDRKVLRERAIAILSADFRHARESAGRQDKEADAPSSLVERQLGALFKEVLQLQMPVQRLDNFFALGGSSLAVTRLCFRIREELGQACAVHQVFYNPTPAGLARSLAEGADGPAENALLTIREGTGPILFFIPGGPGDTEVILFLYRKIFAELPTNHRVVALRARRGDEGELPESVEAMAREYLSDLRAQQPQGPYRLSGACIGGLVALEMARQLRAAGGDVCYLGLIDTAFPSARRALNNRLRRTRKHLRLHQHLLGRGLWQRIAHHFGQARALPPAQRWRYLWAKLGHAARFWRHSTQLHALHHTDSSVARRIERNRVAYQHTLLAYRPEPYPGPIHAIVAGERELRGEAWRDVACGGLVVWQTPGDHDTQITQHAAEVARHLAAGLRQC
ncbi:MAG: AMP-binding protein [Gammaproteobacteria bacterium]|nr:AMP-binding protein [Gammaproteobacteria bacterium]